MKQARVLVADDHDLIRSSIVELVSERFEVVGTVSDGDELVLWAIRLQPDVIVSDIFMPRMDGFAARSNLIDRQLSIPFVFLSSLGKEVVQLVAANSPAALVHKTEMYAHLIFAIDAVLDGQRYLSPYYRE